MSDLERAEKFAEWHSGRWSSVEEDHLSQFAAVRAEARAQALEEAARLAEGGNFLHAEAPDARFGREVARAIRALKEKP
jgi:hypothetical protein